MSGGKSSCLGASFNLINQIVGAGIVGLPYAISQCGFFTGVFMLTFVAYLVDSSVLMLIRSGIKANKYHLEEVAEHYLGKPGYYSTLLFMFILGIGNQVAYLVIIGDTIPIVLQLFLGNIFITKRNTVICGLASFVILPLSLLKDLSSLEWTSLLSVIGVTVLIIIVVVASPYEGKREKIQSEVGFVNSSLFAGIGTISFAIVCQHNSFLVFQSLEEQTYENWRRVAHLSIGFSYILCMMIGLSGYLSFADLTHGDLLTNFPGDDPAVNVARFLLGITSIFAYPMDNYVSRHCIITIIHRIRSEQKNDCQNSSSSSSYSWFSQFIDSLLKLSSTSSSSSSSSSRSSSISSSAKAQYKPIEMNDEINSPRLNPTHHHHHHQPLTPLTNSSIEMMTMMSNNNNHNSINHHHPIVTTGTTDTVFDSLSSSVRRRSFSTSVTTSSQPSYIENKDDVAHNSLQHNNSNHTNMNINIEDGINNNSSSNSSSSSSNNTTTHTRPTFSQQNSEQSLHPHTATTNNTSSSGGSGSNNIMPNRSISHSHNSVPGGGNIYTNTIGDSIENDYENELNIYAYISLSILLWALSLALAIVFTNLGIVLSLTGAVAASIIGFSLPGLIYLKAFEIEFHQAVYQSFGVVLLKRNSNFPPKEWQTRNHKNKKKLKIDKNSRDDSNSNNSNSSSNNMYSFNNNRNDDDDDDDIWSTSNDYESDRDSTNHDDDDDDDDRIDVVSEYGLKSHEPDFELQMKKKDDNSNSNNRNNSKNTINIINNNNIHADRIKPLQSSSSSSSFCYRLSSFDFYVPVFMVFFGFIALISGVGTVIMQG